MQNMPNHFPHQEVIPLIPNFLPVQMPNAEQMQILSDRYTTSSGVPFSLTPVSQSELDARNRRERGSRSRSIEDERGRGRERGRLPRGRDRLNIPDGPSDRDRERMGGRESRSRGSRSRSRSNDRVQRVRIIRGRSGSRSSFPPPQDQIPADHRRFANRPRSRERGSEDLRESLNRHQSAKAEVSSNFFFFFWFFFLLLFCLLRFVISVLFHVTIL